MDFVNLPDSRAFDPFLIPFPTDFRFKLITVADEDGVDVDAVNDSRELDSCKWIR